MLQAFLPYLHEGEISMLACRLTKQNQVPCSFTFPLQSHPIVLSQELAARVHLPELPLSQWPNQRRFLRKLAQSGHCLQCSGLFPGQLWKRIILLCVAGYHIYATKYSPNFSVEEKQSKQFKEQAFANPIPSTSQQNSVCSGKMRL